MTNIPTLNQRAVYKGILRRLAVFEMLSNDREKTFPYEIHIIDHTDSAIMEPYTTGVEIHAALEIVKKELLEITGTSSMVDEYINHKMKMPISTLIKYISYQISSGYDKKLILLSELILTLKDINMSEDMYYPDYLKSIFSIEIELRGKERALSHNKIDAIVKNIIRLPQEKNVAIYADPDYEVQGESVFIMLYIVSQDSF